MATQDLGNIGVRRAVARGIGAFAVAAALAWGLALPAIVTAANPYEPNDSIPSAVGPLALHQTYSAALEYPGDRDFFYFYVTAPKEAQVELEVKNLGGGTEVSDVDANVINPATTTVAVSIPFVRKGETRIGTFSLEPQKYILEVSAKEGYGDAYSVTTSGSTGAFGAYGSIAHRCSEATTSVSALRGGLSRARQRLQRATSRLRRARYASQDARQIARRDRLQAKDSVTAKTDALKTARRAERPWCSIPQ
jgi:hypothetical protein